MHTDRLYQGLDELLPHKAAVEKHLKERLGNLFDLNYDCFCTTSPALTSKDNVPGQSQGQAWLFAGQSAGLPAGVHWSGRHRGRHSSGLRSFRRQYPRQQNHPRHRRGHGSEVRPSAAIWVLDRGMVSEGNLEFLRGRGGQYIVGTPKAMLRKFERALTEGDWHIVQEGVEVKLVAGPDGAETFVLARSADRREKEKAMHQRFLERLQAGLHKLRVAAESGRLRDPAIANRRLGRLLQRYQRAAAAFEVKIAALPVVEAESGKRKKKPPCLAITWTRGERWHAWAELSEGCYLLRTNLVGVDACTLWKRYIQLTDAEWAFRIHKDELAIRPIWHHKEERVQAHILVCFLAYVLWKTLAQWMQRSGLGDAPRTLLRRVGQNQKWRCGIADAKRERSPRSYGSGALRYGARCLSKSAAQSLRRHPADTAVSARRTDPNVVRTFAKNRRNSLFINDCPGATQ